MAVEDSTTSRTPSSSRRNSDSAANRELPVRAILFDAVGTLITPAPSVAAAYAQVGRRHGISLAEEEISKRFHAAFGRQEDLDRQLHQYRTEQGREIARWRGIVADVFADTPHAEAIFADLWEHFAAPTNWELFADSATAWRQLSTAGLTLGIASNFDDRLAGICRELPPLAQCQHLFVSSCVGWKKPSPSFFAAIAEELELRPAELLFVGDDLTNDYLAARAAGWRSLLLDRSGKIPATESVAPTDRIRSLDELAERVSSAA